MWIVFLSIAIPSDMPQATVLSMRVIHPIRCTTSPSGSVKDYARKMILGHEMVLAYLNKGDFFGEMGLFEENERSALVIAKEQCDVAEIQYSKFRELVPNRS